MLPELTEFVPATRMGIVRKLKKGSTRAFFYFDKTTEQVTRFYNTIGNNTADI
jgi:hypothetical protein